MFHHCFVSGVRRVSERPETPVSFFIFALSAYFVPYSHFRLEKFAPGLL
jgi:hypothetical protein